MAPSFVHLHLHTEYSIANGIVRIKPLMKKAADLGMSAVSITDLSNLFAMVKFYRAAIQAGIKPIIGIDFRILNELEPTQPTRLLLLCQNREGYLNLTRLVSRTYIEGQHLGVPMLNKVWLKGASEGLIALSGGLAGDIGQALISENQSLARELLTSWQAFFPDRFYLELHRTGRQNEEMYLHAAVALATECAAPVVATNDVHFLEREDFEAHEARVCIHDGRTLDDPRRPKDFSEQQFLRSPDEMIALFADIPEAIENSVHIAKRCSLELTLGKNYLPNFPVPEGLTTEQYLQQQTQTGLEKRLTFLFDRTDDSFEQKRVSYDERLELELSVINKMGFPGYFLIVADFIQWARNNGVPVGPGRGSGAGSLVAYSLGITDLDPIKYELLFERFLNPERVSMPDFDVDFCMEGRDRVIEYVAEHYGREKVSQIITYGTMAAKAVVRDVGRVLGFPYGFVDQIAKLIPFEIGITLDKAIEQEEILRDRYRDEDDVQTLIDLAKSLEGITRNAGKHAGGVVISPSELTDFTPLYCEQGGEALVSQFDKDDVEAVGLVKFDFLGLRTLTIIDWAVQIINEKNKLNNEPDLDIATIDLEDKATFALLKACGTTAVFQLESRGMKDLIKRLQPDSFDEIIALVALFRPGPLQSGMVDDFIDRKHGAKVDYPHPDIEPILNQTYGVILYQEQVMQIAQVLAGYTLGAADMLRRAMGKKKPEEMAKQRDIFIKGAVERGVVEKTAAYIFDLMEKFAGYGFNKSHSAAYAMVSYQTAWLKAHYPAEFMSAVLSSDMDNTDKEAILFTECKDMGLEILIPHVNSGAYRFTVKDDSTICFGLGAVKGVGEAAIENIVSERNKHGDYKNLFDFCKRIDLRKTNRRTLDALIRGGAFDGLGANRATMVASISTATQLAEKCARDQDSGQDDLFAMPTDDILGNALENTLVNNINLPGNSLSESLPYVEKSEWGDEERLTGEKDTLGYYFTGHPMNRYVEELNNIITVRTAEIKLNGEYSFVTAGLIFPMSTIRTKSGDRMAFITLNDCSGPVELSVPPKIYQLYSDLLMKDKLIVITGEVGKDRRTEEYRANIKDIYDFDSALSLYAKRLVLHLNTQVMDKSFVSRLKNILTPHCHGRCPVIIQYISESANAPLILGKQWRVSLTEELLERLKDLLCESQGLNTSLNESENSCNNNFNNNTKSNVQLIY